MEIDALALVRLLQLADSALPVGAAAHSFGLESMVEEGLLNVSALETFLRDYLEEQGALDVHFCRAAYRVAPEAGDQWRRLNRELSARRLPRESRTASLALGRRLLHLAAELLPDQPIPMEIEAHHVTAFGFVAGMAGIDESSAALAWLNQSMAALVSAMQRLAPVGQTRAAEILWKLKPVMARVSHSSADCFMPVLEIASMRHVRLSTRLFIS